MTIVIISSSSSRRCRLSSSPTTPDPVTSITSHACLSKISKNHTVLLVNVSSDCLHLLRVIDDFGSVEPFLKFGQQSSALGRGGGAALGGGMAASGGSKRFPVLRCSAFAPIIGSSEGIEKKILFFVTFYFNSCLLFSAGTCAVSGSEDGSLCFFDLERELKKLPPCVNKLLGHSKPVISLGFSHNENFLASADSSGQIIVWKK